MNARVVRECMVGTMAALEGRRFVLLLSGGTDSRMVLCAAVEAGLEAAMTVATGRFGEFPGMEEDRALAAARRIAPRAVIDTWKVPREAGLYEELARDVIRLAGSVRKACIEVAVPVVSLLERAAAEGMSAVVSGMDAGALWGDGRRSEVDFHRDGMKAWNRDRVEDLVWDRASFPPNARRVIRRVCASYGMEWLDPFSEPEVIREFMESTHGELHDPRRKAAAERLFPMVAPTHPNLSMQVGLGVREFAQVAALERGFNSATGWYRALARADGIEPEGRPSAFDDWRPEASQLEMVRQVVRQMREGGIEAPDIDEFIPDEPGRKGVGDDQDDRGSTGAQR